MEAVGDALRAHRVAALLLAHGTYAGPDARAVVQEFVRIFPGATEAARRLIEQLDTCAPAEAGNWSQRYAAWLASAINAPGKPPIPVTLFDWSSENNHIGRADGAVRLLDELMALDPPAGSRVLLWGHSHAGNVFALVSNLLGGDRQCIESFFRAAEVYYRWPVVGCTDVPLWDRVRSALAASPGPLADVHLDMVTFGTPIRYGWDSGGYSRLLHFIHRRPSGDRPPYRARFPVELSSLLSAAEGDYVQQLGIAGTNVAPSMLAWRSKLADRNLAELLQGDPAPQDPSKRFGAGAIVPEEGTTLLVDYGPAEGPFAEHVAGHAVYAQPKWMLFHTEEVVRRFYQPGAVKAA